MSSPKTGRLMKILMADDGSTHAKAAAEMLCDLPLPSHYEITVVRVFTPRQTEMVFEVEGSLKQTVSIFAKKKQAVKSEMILGYPEEKIIEYADQINPSLIILGAIGLRATLGILLGGVAQQVIEYANWPVLVVRGPYRGLKRILFVTDGSEYSEQASKFIEEFPLPPESEVSVMHVIPPLPSPEIFQPIATLTNIAAPSMMDEEAMKKIKEIASQEEKQGKILVETVAQRLHEHNLRVNTILCRGDAATEIIAHAKKQQIDLIVAGSRGLSTFQGWLLGSVSRKLVHYAPCSVLVVKGAPSEV